MDDNWIERYEIARRSKIDPMERPKTNKYLPKAHGKTFDGVLFEIVAGFVSFDLQNYPWGPRY